MLGPDTTPPRTVLPRLTDRLALGDQGLRVSPFCLGMVRSSDAVCAAFDAGINFFFLSADMHWPLYEASRRGLERLLGRGRGVRDQVVVAAVSYATQPEFCSAPFAEVLEAVPGLGRIDVPIAGGAYANEFPTRLGVYEGHRRTGYMGARAIGASFHDRQAALLACNHNLVDLVLVRYNPDRPGARDDVFPHLAPRRSARLFNFKSTWGFVPPGRMAEFGLGGDAYWQPDVTDYYRFALSRPEIDGLLVAPGTPAEVAALAAALEKGPLDDEEQAYLIDLAAVAGGRAKVVAGTD
jgi:hypothetical protein